MTRIIAGFLAAISLAGHTTSLYSQQDKVLLPRDASRTISLPQMIGQPYLKTMCQPQGIYDKSQSDDAATVTISPPGEITTILSQFDPSVSRKAFALFVGGQADFSAIVGHFQGQSVAPAQARSMFLSYITQQSSRLEDPSKSSIAADELSDLALLASSSGTLVQLDSKNYFYNVAYQAPQTGSGRSYGIAPGRDLLDQSDSRYLKELEVYLKAGSTADASNFYRAILNVLTLSDASGFSRISNEGQAVATDFMTIYTAELIRHNMVKLDMKTKPWEVDLGEVTLLTDYGAVSGMIMVKGKLIQGSSSSYGTKAIGDERNDIMTLAGLLSSYENASHPELVDMIVNLTPLQPEDASAITNGDVLRRVFVYLNETSAENGVQANASAITNAVIALLQQVRADNQQITRFVQSRTAH